MLFQSNQNWYWYILSNKMQLHNAAKIEINLIAFKHA